MEEQRLTIGVLAARTGCSVPTIRFYEQIGLLPAAKRAPNGHRYYRKDDLARLAFIKRCRDFGFGIEQVRGLAGLADDGDRPCVEVRDMAQQRLLEVRAAIAEMQQLEAGLAGFVRSCDQTCSTSQTRNCVIIEDLSMVEAAAAGAPCCAGRG